MPQTDESEETIIVPVLVPAFALRLERAGSIVIGQVTTGGQRSQIAITGGSFAGEGLSGTVVGGSETLLARGDGVTVVEASYLVSFGTAGTVRAHGTGYRTSAGLRLSLLFEADAAGPLAALTTRAYLAEQPVGEAELTIARID